MMLPSKGEEPEEISKKAFVRKKGEVSESRPLDLQKEGKRLHLKSCRAFMGRNVLGAQNSP